MYPKKNPRNIAIGIPILIGTLLTTQYYIYINKVLPYRNNNEVYDHFYYK